MKARMRSMANAVRILAEIDVSASPGIASFAITPTNPYGYTLSQQLDP